MQVNMKIYVFGTRGFPNIQGGVESHCEKLYSSMPKDINITIFRRKSYLNNTIKSTNPSNINFIDLPSTKVKGFEAFFHSFISTLVCIFKRPDIVHIHNIGPGIFTPILRLFKIKVVLTYHSSNYEHNKWNKFAKSILKLGEFLSLKFSNRIIFVNKDKLNQFPLEIRNKAIFIPNGMQRLLPAENSPIIHSLGLSEFKYILSVGRITEEKGFDYLIDAYIESKIEYPLVIAGGIDHNSKYANMLLEKARHFPNIIFTGFTQGETLRQLYTFAKVFILASYNEGYPIVLLEAINYNKNILASDISANKQIPLPEKCYFKVGNKEALKEKLKEEINNPIANTYYNIPILTWEEVANQVVSIYNNL